MASNAIYRLRQFWHGFQATVTEDELALAAGLLTPAAFALFRRLPIDGQRHSLNVLQTLYGAGVVPDPLAVAALLHDVGKAAAAEAGLEITLWWRGPLVLLETFAPTLLRRLMVDRPDAGWRYLFYVHQEHPQIGAAWAKNADCSELSCWLIAHHQDKLAGEPQDQRTALLQRLQWADSRN
ncbi:MAG: HD domain-containing protein [Caldilineaceae bacterium]